MSEVHLREPSLASSLSPRIKPSPKSSKINSKFYYSSSDDGTDENLLILLHGLGDTHIPFSKLGKSLNLPQTAILALRAPEQVPFLYEDAWQWYPSFDALGETIERPNPTPAIEFLTRVIDHLTRECAWTLDRIHLFGFGQGGTVAAEYTLSSWKKQLITSTATLHALGTIVTISGPLLSYATLSQPCPTPVLVVHRLPPSEIFLPPSALTAFRKAFVRITESKMAGSGGMPASTQEWEPVMKFWSEHLARRQVEGLYEVMSGTSNIP